MSFWGFCNATGRSDAYNAEDRINISQDLEKAFVRK